MKVSKVLRFSLIMLRLSGTDFSESKYSQIKRMLVFIIVISYGVFAQINFDYSNGIQIWLHAVHNFANHIMYIFATISITKYRYEIKDILGTINEFWSENYSNKQTHKTQEKIYKYVMIVMLYYTSASMCVMMIMFGNSIYTEKLPDFASKLREIDSPYFQWIYVWDLIDFWVLVYMILGYASLFYVLIVFCYCQVLMLKNEISKMNFYAITQEDEEKQFAKLKYYVIYHNKVLQFFERICNIFSSFILAQFYINIINICLPLYIEFVVGISSMVTFSFGISIMFAASLQLYVLCLSITYYSEQITSLSDAIYESNWTNTLISSRIKTAMLLIMKRSQKGQHFKAGGILNVNLGSFVSIIQLSYSFYTLVITMQENKKIQ